VRGGASSETEKSAAGEGAMATPAPDAESEAALSHRGESETANLSGPLNPV